MGFDIRHDLGEIVFIQTSSVILALFGWDELAQDATVSAKGAGFRGVTLACNFGSAAEVDAAYPIWLAAGATTVRLPVKKEWGGYSCYVADPDGHLWELAFNPSTRLMRVDETGRLRLTTGTA